MTTINGSSPGTVGTQQTYTISNGVAGDWSFTGTAGIISFAGSTTGVASVVVNFLAPGSVTLRYIGGTTVTRNISSQNPVINGVTTGMSGTRSTYTISNGVPGDWEVVGTSGVIVIKTSATGVASVDVHFKNIGNSGTLRYTSGSTVIERTGIITAAIPISSPITTESGKTGTVSIASGSWTSVLWTATDSIVLIDSNGAAISSSTQFQADYRGVGFGYNTSTGANIPGVINLIAISPIGDEGYSTKSITITRISINFSGPVINQLATITSGDIATLSINPSYDPYADNNPYGVITQSKWTIEPETSIFQGPFQGVTTTDIKFLTFQISGRSNIRYEASNGAKAYRQVMVNTIEITGPTSLLSGEEYDYSVDSTKYATGGSWFIGNSAYQMLSQTSSSLHIKALGSSVNGSLKGTSTGFINYTAGNGGTGKLFTNISRIQVDGETQPKTGYPYKYTVTRYPGDLTNPLYPGYSGGTWSPEDANMIPHDANGPVVYSNFYRTGNPLWLDCYVSNGGFGRAIVNPVFSIYGNYSSSTPGYVSTSVQNTIYIVDSFKNQLILNIPVEYDIPTSGTWSTSTPSLINLVPTGANSRKATATGLLPGIAMAHYFNNNNSVMYTYNITVVAPKPIANDDILSVNNSVGGSFDLISNDSRNGRTVTATTITNYGGLGSSYVTVNSSGLLTVMAGTPYGSYMLKYMFETDYGTSDEANINLTVISPPIAVNDVFIFDMTPGTNGTFNVLENDSLFGKSVTAISITDYGAINPSEVSLATTGELTVQSSIAPGNYLLKYTVTTSDGTSTASSITLHATEILATPEAHDDTVNLDQNTTVQFDLIYNDDLKGRPLQSIVLNNASNYFSVDSNGILTVNSSIAPGHYLLNYTITTDAGTSNLADINVYVTQTVFPPVIQDHEDVATLTYADTFSVNVLDDAQLFGNPITSTEIISFERRAGTVVQNIDPTDYINIDNDGTLTIDAGLNPGHYSIVFTVTTGDGESNQALITFSITQIDPVENTFPSNMLDMVDVTFSVQTRQDSIFVHNATKNNSQLHNILYADYVASKGLPQHESDALFDKLRTYTVREIEMLKLSGKDIFDKHSHIQKRRVETLALPGDRAISTLKVAYDVDDS